MIGTKAFGAFARERLKSLGKSQKALATELGVSPAYVSQIFSGKKNPPDLGRPRNRSQLRTWSQFLDTPEDEILSLIRFELHRVPPRPNPRFRSMRELLVSRLPSRENALVEEIRAMELHPAESRVIQALVQIYLVVHENAEEGPAYGAARFRDLCNRARSSREFVEGELLGFAREQAMSWNYDADIDGVTVFFDSEELRRAMDKAASLMEGTPGILRGLTVPVVAHVSAGEGFAYTDGGYHAGEGFEQIEVPPGVDPALAQRLYCVRVRGDSLREFFSDGTLLFIKPESWEEIRDGDLVIFKDRSHGTAYVKKVEFSGESLILKSMNPLYRNIVLRRGELMLLERVMAIVL
jgi:phage repressor protein C with HTH and peptisase S24 domain/transcriptional regulator with XRE-family HTH domain